jgi:hypothetical protein
MTLASVGIINLAVSISDSEGLFPGSFAIDRVLARSELIKVILLIDRATVD